jgi:hypothetical protein
MSDDVNHPKHYTSHPSGVECIQIVEHMSFNLGNAVKYIWRYDQKEGLQDLEKAIWYIKREIERIGDKQIETFIWRCAECGCEDTGNAEQCGYRHCPKCFYERNKTIPLQRIDNPIL